MTQEEAQAFERLCKCGLCEAFRTILDSAVEGALSHGVQPAHIVSSLASLLGSAIGQFVMDDMDIERAVDQEIALVRLLADQAAGERASAAGATIQ